MRDHRFDPLGQLISIVWAVLVCAVLLTFAVSLLREIWPWLAGITVVVVSVGLGVRLLASSRSRGW